MVRVLVLHEVLHEAKEMEHYISACYKECCVTLCVDASKKEISEIIEKESVDVCFTLVRLKRISGIQIAQKLRKKNAKVKIVFVSDTDEYALDAWRSGVSDYLLRPITMEKIQKTITNI